MEILSNTPFDIKPFEPEGGFFILVDITNSITKIPVKYFYKEGKNDLNSAVGDNWKGLENPDYAPDMAFTKWMTYEYGVSPLPMSPFYNNSEFKDVKDFKGTSMVRFAICKSDETLTIVKERLKKKNWVEYTYKTHILLWRLMNFIILE